MANSDGQIVLGLDIPKTVSQINADIKKLQNQLVKVKATGALDTSFTVKQINSQISALQSQLKTINIKANINISDAQKSGQKIGQTVTDSAQRTIDNKGIHIDKLNADVKALANNLNSFSSKNRGFDILEKEINDIDLRLKETESQMQGMGRLDLSWTDKVKQVLEKFGGSGFATSVMMTLVDQLQKMPQEVYEIDTAMTKLYKVTDETDNKYSKFLDSVSDSAQDLGRSISSLVEQTAKWAKLGFSLDEAEQLAKISSIYANVSEVDNNTAVSNMVTAMKAFNIEAADSITIVDKLNKLGNEYAISAADLGDGLSRSASAMATSGADINKTLAMLTGGTEITQNASEFGDFLKIGSMRIRGMKESLEELGEEVNDTLDSVSKVQTQILNLTGGKVDIFDDMGNIRDYYDIMKDISKVYDDLNDPDKADLTEILFGKQRGKQGAALIQAFESGQIQKALEATLNAEGSAMAEQEKWLESLEAKTQQFEAAFQSLSNTVLDSDLLKWFVDLGTTGVETINSFISELGSLGSIGLGAGLFAGIKNVGGDKMYSPICYLF